VSQPERHAPAFPPSLPTDLSDPEAIRRNDWQAFQSITHMTNHWDRPGWGTDQRSYHWFLTFDNPDLRDLAARCQRALSRLDLDLVPLSSLHMTLLRVGFTGEIPRPRLDDITKAATAACADLAPFAVSLGPLAGSRGAVRFTVTPWTGLWELHDRLSAATAAHIDGIRPDKFRPHVSIAYSNRDLPSPLATRVVDDLRHLPPVSVRVDAAHLVELRREGRTYRWKTHAAVGLHG
jgi:2'-5' RNA ligase